MLLFVYLEVGSIVFMIKYPYWKGEAFKECKAI